MSEKYCLVIKFRFSVLTDNEKLCSFRLAVVFLPCDCNATHGIVKNFLSVCLSVC